MALNLTWQEYAEWLAMLGTHDIEDAVAKAVSLYRRQYNKPIDKNEIRQFYENRIKQKEIA